MATTATSDGAGVMTAGDTLARNQRNRTKKPNYAQIHRDPLPLRTHALPAFHPTHPVSLLRLAYAFLARLLAPPSSHPEARYEGYFSPETRSVHITDPKHVRALWEMGFFGKGTLSRSEPSWMNRELARRQAHHTGKKTAEEATNARREERRQFKLERARLEREKIERQRMIEQGLISAEDALAMEASSATEVTPAPTVNSNSGPTSEAQRIVPELNAPTPTTQALQPTSEPSIKTIPAEPIPDQEHLQLTLEEAFFLTYALGILHIRPSPTTTTPPTSPLSLPNQPYPTSTLLPMFSAHSHFPPRPTHHTLIPPPPPPDDPFLLSYVVYHHFRSLGWVVRPGTKFAVDFLLYLRGPVFSHAEFAVQIVPAYEDPWWSTEEGRRVRRVKGGESGQNGEGKDWWFMHSVNRVQAAVLKTLVLVYVSVPPPVKGEFDGNVGALLRRYRVREFVVRRWVPNRMRD